jgi:hypothetical protein
MCQFRNGHYIIQFQRLPNRLLRYLTRAYASTRLSLPKLSQHTGMNRISLSQMQPATAAVVCLQCRLAGMQQ